MEATSWKTLISNGSWPKCQQEMVHSWECSMQISFSMSYTQLYFSPVLLVGLSWGKKSLSALHYQNVRSSSTVHSVPAYNVQSSKRKSQKGLLLGNIVLRFLFESFSLITNISMSSSHGVCSWITHL